MAPLFLIYCHTSPSGKSYVGVTVQGVTRRWLQHVRDAKRGGVAPLHNAIRKYGAKAFTHGVLDRLSTDAGAKHAERLWIAELGTFGSGYNATAGGDGSFGVRPPAATRLKMSVAQRGVHAANPSRRDRLAAYASRPKSVEHRARMSASARRVAAQRTPEERSRIATAGGYACAGCKKGRLRG
jgi:group I intron endonuclease